MRTLILAQSFYPHWGGTETYTSSLAKFLSEQTVNVSLYSYGHYPNPAYSQYSIQRNRFYAAASDTGIKYHFIFAIQQSADIFYLNKLKKNFDLIHIQGLTRGFEPSIRKIETGIKFKGWEHIKGKPIIITFHEQITPTNINKYVNEAKKCVAVISNNTKSCQLLSEALKKQVHYIPNGVDLDIFNSDHYRKNQINRPFTILCPSRLVEAKGILDIVKAADILVNKQGLHDLQFILINGINFTPGYQDAAFISRLKQEIASHNLYKVFKFIDGRPIHLMPQLYADSDVTIFPSYNEGFGLVVIEAMAMKQPVIATAVGEVPRIISDSKNGFIIPMHNPAKISQLITQLYKDDKLRRQLGAAANTKIQNCFDMRKISSKIHTIYKSVIAN